MDTIHAGLDPESLAADFMAAAGSNDSASLARLKAHLQRRDVLPDFAGTNGITPLMAAAMIWNSPAVEALAAHPLVNLARADNDGWTALHYAAACGAADCVRLLLAHQAPFDLCNSDGETAFDLAVDEKTRDAFRQNRDFARRMGQCAPQAPAAPPAPLPAAAPAEEKKKPEPDPLKDAFFRAMAGIGLQSADTRKALIDKCAAMDETALKDAYAAIRGAGGEFNWDAVFVTAAFNGNTAAMRFLHDQMLFDERTLNQALSAAVAGGGRRSAAHHLMAWGANPSAPYEVGGQMQDQTIFDAAFRLNLFATLEEMMLWRGHAVKDIDAERYRRKRSAAFALTLRDKAKEFRKLRGKKLAEAFEAAVGGSNLAGTMAGYIEAHRDRFLRGNVDISKEIGGGALAVALLHGRYDFARLLIADGYKLSDAPRHLRAYLTQRGTTEALKFAGDHEAGRLENISVRAVGQKRRSEIRVLMSVPYRPHYGMY